MDMKAFNTAISAHTLPIAAILDATLPRVLERIESHLTTGESAADQLVDYVRRYHGKMLRPSLVLVSGLAAHPRIGEAGLGDLLHDDHIVVASVLELIHLATLVHDDILDEAEVRRGHAAIHRLAGNERAVILGDYLFARSYHLCSTLQDQVVALRVGEVSSVVCRGELAQLSHRGETDLSEADYFRIIDAKTGALISGACELGAHASGASASLCRKLARFGHLIGQAFQIQDDVLDLTGDESVVGKSLGRDAEMGKMTLPMIHHRASLLPADRRSFAELIASGEPLNGRSSELLAGLRRTGSIEYASRRARSLVDEAIAILAVLPASPARDTLAAMARAAVERRR